MKTMDIIVLMGPPGCGKSTISKILYNYPHHYRVLSSRDAFDWSQVTKEQLALIKQADMHPAEDKVRTHILLGIFNRIFDNNNIVIDGFPRDSKQADLLISLFKILPYVIPSILFKVYFVYIQPVKKEILIERMINRSRDDIDNSEEAVRARYEAHFNQQIGIDCVINQFAAKKMRDKLDYVEYFGVRLWEETTPDILVAYILKKIEEDRSNGG